MVAAPLPWAVLARDAAAVIAAAEALLPPDAPAFLHLGEAAAAEPVAGLILFDDRGAISRARIAEARGAGLPVVLAQATAGLPRNVFGLASRDVTQAPPWGASAPDLLVLASPADAASVAGKTGLAAPRRVAIGQPGVGAWAWSRLRQPARPGEVVPDPGLQTLGLDLPPGIEASGPPILLTTRPADAAEALRLGWKTLLLAPGHGADDVAQGLAIADGPVRAAALLARLATDRDTPAASPARLLPLAGGEPLARLLAQLVLAGIEAVGRPCGVPAAGPAPAPLRLEGLAVPRGGLVIVSHDWSERTGLARPALRMAEVLRAAGVPVRCLPIGPESDPRPVLRAIPPEAAVLFNSAGMFERGEAALRVYDAIAPARRAIYLHETAWTLERFRQTAPDLWQGFAERLPTALLLCVSAAQARLLAGQYGATRCVVVGNATEVPRPAEAPPPAPAGARIAIAMLGTVQARKGPALFGAVAERAAALALPWDFSWIGHDVQEPGLPPPSPAVRWAGRMEGAALAAELAAMDLLLLSSADDPMPLSVIEALALGKRVVAYAGTGAAEAVAGLPGCGVFADYTPEAALAALQAALARPADAGAIAARGLDLASPTGLAQRVLAALMAGASGQPVPVAA
ncbi:glycosyltransferase family 4 protein [Roseomonas frigidaquae]|uniref:Glycosyltransferase family 4 protein n=1 Tax=Falsiroseomonas frigidaquae TaxID=487318 RepID=A0ABX1F8H2_9PROT|nr:glycosyltransferase [Falsiroseomonas frigidaquae]NKE48684.1 glycosyltransferase family 4 protein [Falsiroseomonas frigidaquae]